LVATYLGSAADLGSVVIAATAFAIERVTAVRSDLAFDTGTYDLGSI